MEKKYLKEATLDGKVKISINIPRKLLEEIDKSRKENKHTRSSWISMATMEKLKVEKIEMRR